MYERTPKSAAIYVRVTPEMHQRFIEKASRFGLPSEVLRKIVEAFVDGRVTITPPTNSKESLYNVT